MIEPRKIYPTRQAAAEDQESEVIDHDPPAHDEFSALLRALEQLTRQVTRLAETFGASTGQANPHRLYKIREVADLLGIGRDAAYKLVYSRGFPRIKVNEQTRVPAIALEVWLLKNMRSTPLPADLLDEIRDHLRHLRRGRSPRPPSRAPRAAPGEGTLEHAQERATKP